MDPTIFILLRFIPSPFLHIPAQLQCCSFLPNVRGSRWLSLPLLNGTGHVNGCSYTLLNTHMHSLNTPYYVQACMHTILLHNREVDNPPHVWHQKLHMYLCTYTHPQLVCSILIQWGVWLFEYSYCTVNSQPSHLLGRCRSFRDTAPLPPPALPTWCII